MLDIRLGDGLFISSQSVGTVLLCLLLVAVSFFIVSLYEFIFCGRYQPEEVRQILSLRLRFSETTCIIGLFLLALAYFT